MSDAGDVVLRLDDYLGRVLPIEGRLYILGAFEMFLAGSEANWKYGQIIRLRDERADAVARVIAQFCPALGGGSVGWLVDATVRGRVMRSEEAKSVAWISDIEEIEVRDHWFTARMRLREPVVLGRLADASEAVPPMKRNEQDQRPDEERQR